MYVSGISSCPVHPVFFSLNKSVQFSSVLRVFVLCTLVRVLKENRPTFDYVRSLILQKMEHVAMRMLKL